MIARAEAGRWIVGAALAAAGLAFVLLVAAGPGTRFGLWHFRIGLGLLLLVLCGGLAAIVLAPIGLLAGGARAEGVLALLVGLGCVAVPLGMYRQSKAVPMIHDITTDTQDPPAFDAVLPQRAGADNPPGYAGAEVAAQQQRAYPDLVPLVLDEPPARVFDRAQAAVGALGWTIVAARPEAGRLEATDTTAWFGFKDDIVVRIRAQGSGSRVDVRSKSRVGRSDLGANARRVRKLLAKLR